jgi:hypothetical protein
MVGEAFNQLLTEHLKRLVAQCGTPILGRL